MTYFTIPASTESRISIPAKAEKPQRDPGDDVERIGVSVAKAAIMLDLCERSVWTLMKTGKLRYVCVGTRRIVSVQSLRDFVNGKKEPCDSKKE